MTAKLAYYWVFLIQVYCILWSLCFARDYRPEVGPSVYRYNDPGVHVRISGKGVQYIGRLSGDLLREGINRFRFPAIQMALPLGASATFYNIKVIRFKPASYYTFKLMSPNKAYYRAENMDITVEGEGRGQILNKDDHGQFTLTLKGVTLETTVLVGRDGNYPKLTVNDCDVSIDSMKISVSGMSHRVIQNVINKNGKGVHNKIIPTLEDELCAVFQKAVNQKFNSQIKDKPLKMPLIDKDSPAIRQFSSSSIERRMVEMLQKMTFDRSLTRDPEFSINSGDFWLRGEISWLEQGGTPFGPGKLYENSFSRSASDKMLYITASDYVINSLLYQAYKKGALNFNVDKREMPEYAKFLRLSCNENSGELCIGGVLPEVSRAYPNADIQIRLTPSEAPAVILADGRATAFFDGVASLYASGKELADIDLAAEMDLKPTLSNNAIQGQMTMKKLTGKLKSSSIKEINQAKIDDWTKMASIMIESLVNDQLQKGVPVPQNRLVKMQNAQLRLLDRRIRLETDLQADLPAVIEMVQKYVDQSSTSPSWSSSRNNRNRKRDRF